MTAQSERDAWLNVVIPAELDAHMAAVGQARTNADIVRRMFRLFPLGSGAKLLVHGCGSCQMFDFIGLPELGPVEIVFADLSPAMLGEARKRLERAGGEACNLVLDDIEHTGLAGPFDAALLVLVLLHVDWKCALENIARLQARRLYVIEQEQAPGVSPVTMKERLLPSMEKYNAVSAMNLVPHRDLEGFLGARGFDLHWAGMFPVPGDKAMMGSVFQEKE